jgi:hypothetical protein
MQARPVPPDGGGTGTGPYKRGARLPLLRTASPYNPIRLS